MPREKDNPTGKRGSVRQLSDAELAERARQAREEAASHTARAQAARQALEKSSNLQEVVDATRSLSESRPMTRRAIGQAGAAEKEIKRRKQQQERKRVEQEAQLAKLREEAQTRALYPSDRSLIEKAEQRLRQQQAQPPSSQNGRRPDVGKNHREDTDGENIDTRDATAHRKALDGALSEFATAHVASGIGRIPDNPTPQQREQLSEIARRTRESVNSQTTRRDGRPLTGPNTEHALHGRVDSLARQARTGEFDSPTAQGAWNDITDMGDVNNGKSDNPRAVAGHAQRQIARTFRPDGPQKKN